MARTVLISTLVSAMVAGAVVLLALLALGLSSATAWGAAAQGAPTDYLPDESAIPDGYEFQGELAMRDGQGETVEKWYVHDGTHSDLRLIAVAAASASVARSICDTAGERLRDDDFDVQPAVVGRRPGIVAERRIGVSYERATFFTFGSACLGVRVSGDEDRLTEGSEGPIIGAMVARGRSAGLHQGATASIQP
jgi:hypothetical protein